MRHRLLGAGIVAVAATAAIATSASAGITTSTSAAGPWSAGFVLKSSAGNDPTTSPQTGQFVTGGTTGSTGTQTPAITQTFTTGASGFQLDKIQILTGGMAGTPMTLHIFPNPVGGAEADGFVNNSFSTSLLGGGAGVSFTVFGAGGTQLLMLDLTGTDQITLAANTKYSIDLRMTGSTASNSFQWIRTTSSEYSGGNIYVTSGATGGGGEGERFAVASPATRDAMFALYAVPEPSSMALLAFGGVALLNRRRRD